MEDKNKAHQAAPEKTEAHPQVKLMDKEPITVDMEKSPEPVAVHVAAPVRRPWKFTAFAIVLVVVALLAVLFRLEKEGRVGSTFFSGVIASQEANAKVATVNGEVLRRPDLTVSANQLAQTAAAQGLDPTNPSINAEIEAQALEMIVNTELLVQQAAEQGIVIDDAAIAERIAVIEADAGGADVLDQRLVEFDLTREQLTEDVEVELLISALLETVFADAAAEIVVTEEEIAEVYTGAGGAEAGLPPLDDVRDQIAEQLKQSKEQVVIDQYLTDIRTDADIEIHLQ